MGSSAQTDNEGALHDVFVSYAIADKSVADRVVHALETKQIRCWYAPRDVPAGSNYGAAIVGALKRCRVLVLVHSTEANSSKFVQREVERAVTLDKVIVPLRIDQTPPSEELEFFLGTPQWLDFSVPPLEQHLPTLVAQVGALVTPRAAADERHDPGGTPRVPLHEARTLTGNTLLGRRVARRTAVITVVIGVASIVGIIVALHSLSASAPDGAPAAVDSASTANSNLVVPPPTQVGERARSTTTSRPVVVADLDLGRAVLFSRVVESTREFSPTDTVYTAVHTTGSASEAVVMARWTFEDGQVVNESRQTIAPTGHAYTEFHISKPGGLPKGRYKVEVFLDGNAAGAVNFDVR